MSALTGDTWPRVRLMLSWGYGVEDIALDIGCSADEVRRYVQSLRDNGKLRSIVRPG